MTFDFLLAALLAGPSLAANPGTTGSQFLKVGPGARPAGMGMAYTAVADDLSAIHFNPAGLARQDKHQATASYIRYFQEVHYGFVGLAPAAQSWGAIGLGVAYLTLDGVEGRKGDTEVADRSFGATDAAFTASYARRDVGGASFPGLSVGGSAKLITQMLDGSRGVTGAADVGALYETKAQGLTLGLAVRNIGPGVKYVSVRDPLPMTATLGAAYRVSGAPLLFAGDLEAGLSDSVFYESLGAEYTFKKIVAVRAGWRFGAERKLGGLTGLTAGGGVHAGPVLVDYAFVPFGDLGDTHRFSLSFKF